MLELTTSI